jgi:hypothetical protein
MRANDICGAAVIASALFLVSGASAQDQQRGSNPNHPLFAAPITNVEIISALRGPDDMAKYGAAQRAMRLPPNTLRASTIKAISDEILKMQRADQRRFKDNPLSINEDSSHFELIVEWAEVLMNQQNPAGIDGLAAVVHYGKPIYSLIAFGDSAVPALVRAASFPEDEFGHAKAALDALQQMLNTPKIRQTISAQSLAGMKQVASQWLANAKGDDDAYTLNEAAYLAVATGDPQLRKQVAALAEGDAEFVKRGMSIEAQQLVADGARKALAEAK